MPIEVFRQAHEGELGLDDPLEITNSFSSIIDGSPYELSVTDDSDAGVYARLATLGAGATNLATAAAHAHLGSFPVLFVTGQKPIRENQQGLYQLLDVTSLMAPITKFARTIESGPQIAHVVHDAFRTMRDGRPGPVHLELPEDVANDATDGRVSFAGHGAAPIVRRCLTQSRYPKMRRWLC